MRRDCSSVVQPNSANTLVHGRGLEVVCSWSNQHQQLNAKKPRPRSAFTLLELLIALALSVVLITAVYGAISLFVQVSHSDESNLDRSRLARSVMKLMSSDIQSVLFRPEEIEALEEAAEEGTDTTASSESTTDGTTDTSTITDATADFDLVTLGGPQAVSNSLGLVGDSTKLMLHTSKPGKHSNYSPISVTTGLDQRTSDLVSVSYFLADPNGIGLSGEVGQLASREKRTDIEQNCVQGLARLEGDRMTLDNADVTADIDTMAAAARVLAPEIISLRFEYYDGTTWQETWDSTLMGRLPNAVAIELGFRHPYRIPESLSPHDLTPGERLSFTTVVETQRHVVSLPTSIPFSGGL